MTLHLLRLQLAWLWLNWLVLEIDLFVVVCERSIDEIMRTDIICTDKDLSQINYEIEAQLTIVYKKDPFKIT